MQELSEEIKKETRIIENFPKKGISFFDVTTVLKNNLIFNKIIDSLTLRYRDKELSAIVGLEARGFIFASPLAYNLNLPFIPIRKEGKLPFMTNKSNYSLEYGEACFEIHQDALCNKDKVVIIDDLLATGGTAIAASKLVSSLGAEIHELAFIYEIASLEGRKALENYKVFSICG